MDYFDELDDTALAALCELDADFNTASPPPPTSSSKSHISRRPKIHPRFLIKLEGPIATPESITDAIHLPRTPSTTTAEGETGTATFCSLSKPKLLELDTWLRHHYPAFCPTKIRVVKAHMDDTPPTLGKDPTMPQHRPESSICKPTPVHFPKWYFFYGTLAERDILARVLDVSEISQECLFPATVKGGAIKTWQNKYKALVDEPGGVVAGRAYQVASAEHEDKLRVYETENYEVVEADMDISLEMAGDGAVLAAKGFTFRFAGYEDELS